MAYKLKTASYKLTFRVVILKNLGVCKHQEKKYKIECKIQILIMFQLFTFEENPLFKLDFIMIEKEFKSQHRQVKDQL